MLWGSLFEQGSCSLNAAGVNRRRFFGGGRTSSIHPQQDPSPSTFVLLLRSTKGGEDVFALV